MKKILFLAFVFANFAVMAQRIGADYAVFFVASKFDNGWTTLDQAPAEVKAISDLLRDQYGFEVRIVSDATRAKIVQTLAEYKRKAYGPQDQLLLFFSMHGVHDMDSDQGYLVPKDGLYDDPSYESWYSHAALRDLAHSMKCPRILIALDACYSGIFGKGRDKPGPPPWENKSDCQTKLRAAFGEGITRKYLTAGGDTRVPARSIFAAQWQVALKTGTGNDDLLSYTELMAKLDEFRDPRPTWGNFIPGTDGDFVFVRKNPCVVLSDRDGDNIPDASDQCPDEWGSQANGCPAQPNNTPDLAADLAAWKEAKRLYTETSYRNYLRQYPNGEFKDQANTALRGFEAAAARRRDDTAWDLAEEKNTLDAYKKYLADYPAGEHKTEADQKVSTLTTAEKARGAVMPDRDGDGVADKDDACPDKKGDVSHKGCPDADGDGIYDDSDRCPDKPGVAALRGCPEIKKADKAKLERAIQLVRFEPGKAVLLEKSYDVLDEVVSVMKQYTEYGLNINGHTDNAGDDAMNQSLSENRAKACYDYLVFRGIAAGRMTHAGYGETKPIADNSTLAGREQNRRVEFELSVK